MDELLTQDSNILLCSFSLHIKAAGVNIHSAVMIAERLFAGLILKYV